MIFILLLKLSSMHSEKKLTAFDISNLPVLNAFLRLDPQALPDRDSPLFESYCEEELKVFHVSMELVHKIYSSEERRRLAHFMTHIILIYVDEI